MTAKYIAETNELQELPEPPPIEPKPLIKGAEGIYDREMYEYGQRFKRYKAAIATLRLIPCDPSCREVFKDGEVYEEGKDYEVKGADEWKWCYQLKGNIFAAAITVKTEDDLWREALDTLVGAGHYAVRANHVIEELKKHYTLIKK